MTTSAVSMNGEADPNTSNNRSESLTKTDGFNSLQNTRDSFKAPSREPRVSLDQLVPRINPVDDDYDADAPSDEEDGAKRVQNARQAWLEKEEKSRTSNSTETTSPSTPQSNRKSLGGRFSPFEVAKLKFESETRHQSSLIAPLSWHGDRRYVKAPSINFSIPMTVGQGRRKSAKAPLKHFSNPLTREAPQDLLPPLDRANAVKKEPGSIGIPLAFLNENLDEDDQSLSMSQVASAVAIPEAFRQKSAGSNDEGVTIPPIKSNARNKFVAMEDTPDLNSSTTSFVTELPPMPRRRKCDDDSVVSTASSYTRGGRIFEPAQPKSLQSKESGCDHHLSQSQAKAMENTPSLPSRERDVSLPETKSNLAVGEMNDVFLQKFPLSGNARNGSSSGSMPRRSDSGSSHNISIPTFDDENDRMDDELFFDDEDELSFEELHATDDKRTHEYIPLKSDAEPEDKDFHPPAEEHAHNGQGVDKSGVKEFVVDRVPKKRRWSSKNAEDSPLWPPIIRVKTWEKRNVSGISIGSGFTGDDSLTVDSQDFLSSLGADDLSYAEEDFVRHPPERRTSYRIRYDGPTSLKLSDIYKLSPVPQSDDRFEPTSRPPDGAPHMPARRVVDSAPHAPARETDLSIGGDESMGTPDEDDEEKQNRPDVWITPMAGTVPNEAMWRVKRVWAIGEEDENEQEHDVHKTELFNKIKTLVGAPGSPSIDDAPKLPQRSWHVQNVVEKKGRLLALGTEKYLSDDKFNSGIEEMEQDALEEIEINQKAIEEFKQKIENRKAEKKASTKDVEDMDDENNIDKSAIIEASDQEASESMQETSPPETSTIATGHQIPSTTEAATISQILSTTPKLSETDTLDDCDAEVQPQPTLETGSDTDRGEAPIPAIKSNVQEGNEANLSPLVSTSSKKKSKKTKHKKSPKKKIDVAGLIFVSPKTKKTKSPPSSDCTSPLTPTRLKPRSKSPMSPKKPIKKKKKKKKELKSPKSKNTILKEIPLKETETPSKVKCTVPVAAMVHESSDSDNFSGGQHITGSDDSSSDMELPLNDDIYHQESLTARVALTAMVHDSSDSELGDLPDSEEDESDSEDDIGTNTPIRGPGRTGWWKKGDTTPTTPIPGRRRAPSAGRPNTPPMSMEKGSTSAKKKLPKTKYK